MGSSPKARIESINSEQIKSEVVDRGFVLGAFNFPKPFFSELDQIKVNRLSSPVLYHYHSQGWRRDKGVYFTQSSN